MSQLEFAKAKTIIDLAEAEIEDIKHQIERLDALATMTAEQASVQLNTLELTENEISQCLYRQTRDEWPESPLRRLCPTPKCGNPYHYVQAVGDEKYLPEVDRKILEVYRQGAPKLPEPVWSEKAND